MNLPNVEGVKFRPVVGLDGYLVGDDSSVWSRHTIHGSRSGWHRMSTRLRPGRTAYYVVDLRENSGKGKVATRYVHRLVLEAFIGPCPKGMECRHLDGNATNNRLTNLQWGTRAENDADMMRHGTRPRGEKHKNTKYTDEFVGMVRELRRQGMKPRHIAAKLKLPVGKVCYLLGKARRRSLA